MVASFGVVACVKRGNSEIRRHPQLETWIADCESVKMTMLFTHGGLGLSQSLEMVCKAECIAFSSAS